MQSNLIETYDTAVPKTERETAKYKTKEGENDDVPTPYLDEPRCRICTRLGPSPSVPRAPQNSRYRSFVARPKEYCDPRRCHVKVAANLRPEFGSRPHNNVDRIVNKIQEVRRNVRDLDEARSHAKAERIERRGASGQSAGNGITDWRGARDALENCSRQIKQIKTFLNDENAWWKILKERPFDCCQHKLPHLHGILDGSSVVLTLLEEGNDEIPRCFMTSTPKKDSSIGGCSARTSSKEFPKEYTEQPVDAWEECREEAPYYSLDTKSTLFEANSERRDPSQGYAKTTTTSKRNIASEFWVDLQDDVGSEHQTANRSTSSRDRVRHERREEKPDRSNVATSRDTRHEKTREDPLRPRETFSSENTGSMKRLTADFESNVDLYTELPSNSTGAASRRPRTRTITVEKTIRHARKPLMKIFRPETGTNAQ